MRQIRHLCLNKFFKKAKVKLSNSKKPGDKLKLSLHFIKNDSTNLFIFFDLDRNMKEALFHAME